MQSEENTAPHRKRSLKGHRLKLAISLGAIGYIGYSVAGTALCTALPGMTACKSKVSLEQVLPEKVAAQTKSAWRWTWDAVVNTPAYLSDQSSRALQGTKSYICDATGKRYLCAEPKKPENGLRCRAFCYDTKKQPRP